ncbi:MAG: HEAT repeat domain-containing protein [Victivallaceae bacterium]|jgi:hypothetical protein
MRLIELTLLVGLFVSGYPGHGQDAVKNQKSVAPGNPVTAKVTQPTTTVEKNAEVLLPDNIKLIIGQGADRNYYVRVREIHNLKKNLSPGQIDALYKFLYEKLDKQELPDLQFNGLKNEIVVELMKQTIKPETLSGHLVAMYHDKTFDPTWRDYCVQFFGKWYPNAPDNKDRHAMYDGLFEAVKEVDGSIAGAALAQLSFLAGAPGFEGDRDRVSDLACGVLTDPKCSPRSRIVAMQVCAELRNKKALPIAREAAQDSNDISFKMASMAAIGALGDPSDLPLLNHYKSNSDIRLSGPAKAAIAKINKNYKLSKY